MFNIIWLEEGPLAESDFFIIRKLTAKFDFSLTHLKQVDEQKIIDKPCLAIASSGLAKQLVAAQRRRPLGLLAILVYCLKKGDKKELANSSFSIKLVTNNIQELFYKCDEILTAKGLKRPDDPTEEGIQDVEVEEGRPRRMQLDGVFEDASNRFLLFREQRLMGEFNDPADYEKKIKPFVSMFSLDFDIEKDLKQTKKQMAKDLQDLFTDKKVAFLEEQLKHLDKAENVHDLVRAVVYLYTLEKGNIYKHLNYVLKNIRYMRFREQLKKMNIFANLLLLNYFFYYGSRKTVRRVYRYTDCKILPDPDTVIMVTNFYSTSLDSSLSQFADRPTKIVIDCCEHGAGSFFNYVSIQDQSAFKSEQEVLYCPFTKFKVYKVDKDGTTATVFMRELPDNPILRSIFDNNFLQENLKLTLCLDKEFNYQSKYQKLARKEIIRHPSSKRASFLKQLLLRIRNNYGTCYLVNDRPREAFEYFKEQLEERCKELKLEFNLLTAKKEFQSAKMGGEESCLLTNIALCLQKMGNLQQSEALLYISLAIKKRLNLDTSTFISNLGSLLIERGALAEAEKCYKEGLATVEAQQGRLSSKYATLLNNMAFLELERGLPDKALSLCGESERLFTQVYGENCYQACCCVENRAEAYLLSGRLEEAIEALTRVIQLQQTFFGPKAEPVLMTITKLGSVLNKAGKEQQALDWLLRAVGDGMSVFGAKSPILGRVVFNVGSLYYTLCELDHAKRYLEWAREIFAFKNDEGQMQEVIDRTLASIKEALQYVPPSFD